MEPDGAAEPLTAAGWPRIAQTCQGEGLPDQGIEFLKIVRIVTSNCGIECLAALVEDEKEVFGIHFVGEVVS